MKLLAALIFLFILKLVYSNDEVCILVKNGFNLCIKSGYLARVQNINQESHFGLAFKTNLTIGDYAFADTGLKSIRLGFVSKFSLFEKSPSYILTLKPNSFAGLTNLTSLHLLNMPINSTASVLEPLKGLKTFKWEVTDLIEVPSEKLNYLPNLEELFLFSDGIKVIRSKAFVNMTNLKHLNFSFNPIRQLEMGCFDGLGNLERLDLSLNHLESLPAVFGGLGKLKVLGLGGGRIETFEPNALRGLTSLTQLTLEGNRLKNLAPDTFSYSPNLQGIKLNGFYGLRVTKGLLNNLHSLDELYLSNYNITDMEPEALSGLNLTTLSIHTCTARILDCLYEFLSGAKPNPGFLKPYKIPPRAFHGLTAKRVDLGHNSLKNIGAEDFSGLSAEVLDLGSNEIEKIAPGAFKKAKVDKIILENNPICNVNKTVVGLPESAIVLEKFRKVEKKKRPSSNDDDDD